MHYPGRTLTAAHDIYAGILGIIYRHIELPVLERAELCEIAVKTLNLARREQRSDAYPFTDEVIDRVAKASHGIPRQFNINCAQILEAATRLGYKELDHVAFDHCFEDVQAHTTTEIDAQARRLLYVASKYGGLSQDNRQALTELGMGDFFKVLPLLEQLNQQDLLIRLQHPNGIRFVVPDRAQKAAEAKD